MIIEHIDENENNNENNLIFDSYILKYIIEIILNHASIMYKEYGLHVSEYIKHIGPHMVTNYCNFCLKCICINNITNNININMYIDIQQKFVVMKDMSNISELTLLTMIWMIVLKTYTDININLLNYNYTNEENFINNLTAILPNIIQSIYIELLPQYREHDLYNSDDIHRVDPNIEMFTIHSCNHAECGSVCEYEYHVNSDSNIDVDSDSDCDTNNIQTNINISEDVGN